MNRDAIVEARKRFLEPLRFMLTTRATLRQIRELNPAARPEIDPMLAEIDAYLEGSVGPAAEYSAMARAVIGAR